MRIVKLATLIALLAPSIAIAEDSRPDCSGSQQDMNQCADATARAADNDLNIRYGQAMENARDGIAQAKLRAAQRAWIPYRDAACAMAGDSARGGSLAPLLTLSCLQHMTSMRALELSHDQERTDPGLWVGGALALLREKVPADALRGVYWLPEGVVSADFDQDGMYDLASAGLHTPGVDGGGGKVHVLVLLTGSTEPLHATVPIGGGGLCAAPVTIRVEYPAGGKPVLAIDDGACDAFRFSVEGPQLGLFFTRN